MHPQTPTYSDARSENSVDFPHASRKPVKGVDYSKYKTRMCRHFMMGAHCPFGEHCAFAHGETAGHSAEEPPPPPPPPAYNDAVQADVAMPPAYPSRFRHDPYSFNGVMFED